MLEYLQEAGRRNLSDFFYFRVGLPTMDLDGAPYGGSRYPVEKPGGPRVRNEYEPEASEGE